MLSGGSCKLESFDGSDSQQCKHSLRCFRPSVTEQMLHGRLPVQFVGSARPLSGTRGQDKSWSSLQNMRVNTYFLPGLSSDLPQPGLGPLQVEYMRLRATMVLTDEGPMNSDRTSSSIGSETARTHQDHAVQRPLHLPWQRQQQGASSSPPIPAATLFLGASGGLDPRRHQYAPASPRLI